MNLRLFYKRLSIAALFSAAFFLTGCSSPEKTARLFLVDCLSGDYDSASRFAGPEIMAAFRTSVDEAGGIAPIRSDVETRELHMLVSEYFDISIERRMKFYAVVRLQPDWDAIAGDASGLKGSGFESGAGEYQETFRLLMVQRRGTWIVGGVLLSDS